MIFGRVRVCSQSNYGPQGVDVDETVAEELQFHQQTVATDANSPLHLIREKELEISGRMLAAKRKADEVVSDARRKAATIVATAQDDARGLADEREKLVRVELDQKVTQIQADSAVAVEELGRTIEQKREQAVLYVVDAVMGR